MMIIIKIIITITITITIITACIYSSVRQATLDSAAYVGVGYEWRMTPRQSLKPGRLGPAYINLWGRWVMGTDRADEPVATSVNPQRLARDNGSAKRTNPGSVFINTPRTSNTASRSFTAGPGLPSPLRPPPPARRPVRVIPGTGPQSYIYLWTGPTDHSHTIHQGRGQGGGEGGVG